MRLMLLIAGLSASRCKSPGSVLLGRRLAGTRTRSGQIWIVLLPGPSLDFGYAFVVSLKPTKLAMPKHALKWVPGFRVKT